MSISNSSSTSAASSHRAYFDRHFQIEATKVLPGEFVATNRDMLIVTVLGSCVSACIRDAKNGVAGMNHFMLPDAGFDTEAAATLPARYGMYAMEVLVNEMLKLGAERKNLEAKVFGGGHVLKGMLRSNVGERNAEFVKKYLADEGIRLVAEDLLDSYPRKLYFFSGDGRVLVKKIRDVHNRTIFERELNYRDRLKQANLDGGVELF